MRRHADGAPSLAPEHARLAAAQQGCGCACRLYGRGRRRMRAAAGMRFHPGPDRP